MGKLKNAPLYYVVAQVQFNAVLEIDNFLPSIQSRMREANYPDYKSEVVQSVMFSGPVDGQPFTPSMTKQTRHSFGDIHNQSIFLLDANALTFHTTAYETFEDFSKKFMLGLEIVHKAMNLALVERIGIRYLDAIFPLNDGETLEHYLVPEVRGLYNKFEGQFAHSFSETMGTTSVGQIISRTIVRNTQVGFPDDLSNRPVINPRFTQWNGLHAIVDSDSFDIKREVFDLTKISVKLDELHELISTAFSAAVTKEAWDKWA